MQYCRNGQRFRESSQSTNRADAERLLKRRFGEIVTGKFAFERVTLSQLFDLLIQDYELHERRSIDPVRWRIKKHLEPALGKLHANEFGRARAEAYIVARRRAGATNATINRELAALRRAFHVASQYDPPMVSRVPHIPRLPENNVRQGFLELKQYLALLEALPGYLKPLLVVGYHLGNRLGELRSLRWDQVDLKAGEIRLTAEQTKNKRPRTLPIYGDIGEWLTRQKAERDQFWPDCHWVFRYLGKPIGNHVRGWKKACEAAGVPGLLFHDLRRSAVRNMERAGVPRSIAMSISGHRTESVYRRYDIVSGRDLKLAAEKMEAHARRDDEPERGDS